MNYINCPFPCILVGSHCWFFPNVVKYILTILKRRLGWHLCFRTQIKVMSDIVTSFSLISNFRRHIYWKSKAFYGERLQICWRMKSIEFFHRFCRFYRITREVKKNAIAKSYRHWEVNPGTDFPLAFMACMLPSEVIPYLSAGISQPFRPSCSHALLILGLKFFWNQ